MIANDRQYQVTKARADEFARAIADSICGRKTITRDFMG